MSGTIVNDNEMGEVIQLQGDQRKDVQEFLVDKKEGLELDAKTIKVRECSHFVLRTIHTRPLSSTCFGLNQCAGPRLLSHPLRFVLRILSSAFDIDGSG